MFIVVMLITLVSAAGVFAVRSAGQADLGAGYQRQALQSSYLSEFAARAVAAEMSVAPDAYLNPFLQPLADPPTCRSTADSGTICFTRQHHDLLGVIDSSPETDTADELIGTLGYGDSRAAFHIEIFEATQAPERQAGENETTSFRQATILAEARVRPIPADIPEEDTDLCDERVATTTAVQAVRGHVRFGPFSGE